MKKEMIIKNCDLVLCVIKRNDLSEMVLPQIRFNYRYFSEQDFDLDEDDYNLIRDIRYKYLVLNIDSPQNYLTWKVHKGELPRHIKAMIVKFDSLEEFNKKTVW